MRLHRRIGANAAGERQQHRDSESRRAPQGADGDASVLGHLIHASIYGAPSRTSFLKSRAHAAELMFGGYMK